MKIRNGFVSNSSSSSFVILGVKYEIGDKNEYDMYEIWNWRDGNLRTLCDEGVYYCGLVLAESDCDFMESVEYTRTELGNAADVISKKLGVSLDDVKIYIGTRSC